MKVTLISPSMHISASGIRMISACLKRAGHQTKIIFIKTDICKQCDEKTIDSVIKLASGADLVGFSLTTNFFEISAQITKRIKEEIKIPVIWGGIHPTVRPEECLEYADIVCRGEGGEAIVELTEKLTNGSNYSDIRNLCFKDKQGGFIINPLRPLIQNLDSLPFLDYDPRNHHIIAEGVVDKMDSPFAIALWDDFWFVGYIYTTFITRGCPFSCTYCCNNTLNKLYHGQKVFRVRSVDNVIEELRKIKQDLPFIKCIVFNDEYTLGLPLQYFKEFSEKYKKFINLPMIIVGAHPSAIDEKKLEYLTSAGDIKFLTVGIQTASKTIKKLFKIDYPNSHVIRTAKIINKFKNKIRTISFHIIVDNPWQTEEDLIETLMLLSKLPTPYHLNICSLALYPGTEIYELAKKENLIHDERKEIYQKDFMFPNRNCYLNKIFFLLSDYAIYGKKIPPIILHALTNKLLLKLKISYLIYYFFRKKTKKITELRDGKQDNALSV